MQKREGTMLTIKWVTCDGLGMVISILRGLSVQNVSYNDNLLSSVHN
jgi:hypothetical protein